MTLQALLVSADDEAAAVLRPVLAGFGMSLLVCGPAEAIGELTRQKFDAVLADFDDAPRAALALQNASSASAGNSMVTVALLREPAQVRGAFGAGAHFVLYKPISSAQAQASLQAATILIKRERRRSLRIPVQTQVQLKIQTGLQIEGILLDLSEDGVEVLAAQPLCPSASLQLQFVLPDSSIRIDAQGEVAWANPNGQCGVRFAGLPQTTRTSVRDWIAKNSQKLPPEEATAPAACKLTDLSTGGCYVETSSPFPERSGVVLRIEAAAMKVQAQGMVRVMHPGCGMGIEFASRTSADRDETANFIKFLLSFPGTSPELMVMPGALAAGAEFASGLDASEFEDPLLDLLRNHETLNQEEFLQELQKQRGLSAVTV